MNKAEIIERLRVIFTDVVLSVEDSEYDDPEYLTGEIMDFVKYRSTTTDSMLHKAAFRGELEGAKLLVELGLEIDFIGDMGTTPLHSAAGKGSHDVYDFLVSQGASEDIVSELGYTPRQLRYELYK